MSVAPVRPWTARLAIRFAFILAVALLPAGIIAFVQTNALEREIRVRSEVALIGSTIKAAAEETALISRVRGMVGSLAGALPSVVDDPEACSELMRRVAEMEPSIKVAAFIPLSGEMTCSSADITHDFNSDPQFEEIAAAEAPYFLVNPVGPISGVSILGISHPVYDRQGEYIGYAGMSIPHASLRELAFTAFFERSGFDSPVLYWTFDKSGRMLSSNRDLITWGPKERYFRTPASTANGRPIPWRPSSRVSST
jgi:two-component system, sensor histidine kinase PdtaS